VCTKELGRYKNCRQKAAKYVIYLGSSCPLESCHISQMLHTMGNGPVAILDWPIVVGVFVHKCASSVYWTLLISRSCVHVVVVCLFVCVCVCERVYIAYMLVCQWWILHICLCVNDEWLMSLGRLPACSYLAAAAATLQVIMHQWRRSSERERERERETKKERKKERERERKLGISQW
jgi:hypothetical protein